MKSSEIIIWSNLIIIQSEKLVKYDTKIINIIQNNCLNSELNDDGRSLSLNGVMTLSIKFNYIPNLNCFQVWMSIIKVLWFIFTISLSYKILDKTFDQNYIKAEKHFLYICRLLFFHFTHPNLWRGSSQSEVTAGNKRSKNISIEICILWKTKNLIIQKCVNGGIARSLEIKTHPVTMFGGTTQYHVAFI